jgi:anti-anti-sigma factor
MVRIEQCPGATLLVLGVSYESLDEAVLDEFGGLLLTVAATADPPRVVLDLAATRLIGSRFIELMIRAWKRLAQRGGRLALCGVQPFCAEVLRVTRLDTLWEIFDDRAGALASLAPQ